MGKFSVQELKPLSRVSRISAASGWGIDTGRRGGKSENYRKFVGKNAETPRQQRRVSGGIFSERPRFPEI